MWYSIADFASRQEAIELFVENVPYNTSSQSLARLISSEGCSTAMCEIIKISILRKQCKMISPIHGDRIEVLKFLLELVEADEKSIYMFLLHSNTHMYEQLHKSSVPDLIVGAFLPRNVHLLAEIAQHWTEFKHKDLSNRLSEVHNGMEPQLIKMEAVIPRRSRPSLLEAINAFGVWPLSEMTCVDVVTHFKRLGGVHANIIAPILCLNHNGVDYMDIRPDLIGCNRYCRLMTAIDSVKTSYPAIYNGIEAYVNTVESNSSQNTRRADLYSKMANAVLKLRLYLNMEHDKMELYQFLKSSTLEDFVKFSRWVHDEETNFNTDDVLRRDPKNVHSSSSIAKYVVFMIRYIYTPFIDTPIDTEMLVQKVRLLTENKVLEYNPNIDRILTIDELEKMSAYIMNLPDVWFKVAWFILKEIAPRTYCFRHLTLHTFVDGVTGRAKTVSTILEKHCVRRTIVISPRLQTLIEEYSKTFPIVDEKTPLFTRAMVDSVIPMLRGVAVHLGITTHIYIHMFRYTLCTNLEVVGNQVSSIAKYIGHGDFNTTSTHYIRHTSDTIDVNKLVSPYDDNGSSDAGESSEDDMLTSDDYKVLYIYKILQGYEGTLKMMMNHTVDELDAYIEKNRDTLPSSDVLLDYLAASTQDGSIVS